MDVYPIHLLIPFLVLLPNLLYGYFQPRGLGQPARINPIYSLFEKIGQIGMVALPLFFAFNAIAPLMVAMALLLILYYIAWARYFHTRSRRALYSQLLLVPLPLATLPVVYFLFAAIQFNSLAVYAAWFCLAIGHIAVTRKQGKALNIGPW